jgi:putative PEP-CTERM system histidine kinase
MNSTALIDFLAAVVASGLICGSLFGDRRSLAHKVFLAGMLLLALESLFTALAADANLPRQIIRWQNWGFTATAFLPGTWLLFSLTYGRGNYSEFVAKWRIGLALMFVAPLVLAAFFRGSLVFEVRSISGQDWVCSLGWGGIALNLFLLLGAVLVLMNLERTYRAAVGMMRWRMKYLILGIGVLFAARAYTSSQCLLFRSANPSLQAVNAGALVVACVLMFRWLVRAGRFEVSVYPSHSVLHHSLTVLIAGVYLLVVGVFAKIVTLFGGDGAFTLKAFGVLVLLVGLSIILLSDRVRLHTKRFVSRHFQRPLYNYRTVWGSFAAATASCVRQTELCQAVVKLLTEIFQLLSATIWIVEEKDEKFTFGASSSLSESRSAVLKLAPAEAAEVIRALRTRRDPVDIDAVNESWTQALRRCHPAEFRTGGHRVCVPVVARDQLLGIMLLGDRVGGIPFSTQDFDLLRCVGDQVAASLLNIELSRRLLEAKELEAFQTMSAFFVHDLKNTASTLSLMLQNLPAHYNDPAFREDALRGLGKAAQHIDDLIKRLTLLRQEMAIRPAEVDLNELVAKVLATLERSPRARIVQELRPLPKQAIDSEQLEKVIVNLLLNAHEALNGEGEIRVATQEHKDWTVVSVSDNGCGMPPDFVQRSLFRPFQTTKKHGIGIGMFQSKMIVEAHHGRIEVESEVGKGTTFRVLLPVKHTVT